jgi:molybdopterin biosynthesis enzyme
VHTPENPRIARFTPLDDAYARLAALAKPVAAQDRAVENAVGLVLAEDVVAREDLPATPTAYADGWAVNAEELVGATAYSAAILAPPPEWVESDDEMPSGADAVLPPEAIATSDPGMAEAQDSVAPGHGVRNTGQDIEAGTVMIAAGQRLAPRHIGLLKACGVKTVKVRVPRVRLVIASRSAERHADMMRLWLQAAGAELIETVGAFEKDALVAAYKRPGNDLILSLGGTGQGRTDAAVAALKDAGTLDLHGVALRPGGSAAFGEVGGVPVLLLGGRMDSLIAGGLTLGARAVNGLAGLNRPSWRATSPITQKVTSIIGFTEIFLAVPEDGGMRPIPLNEASFDAVARAAGWFTLSPESEGLPAGQTVQVRPFSPR